MVDFRGMGPSTPYDSAYDFGAMGAQQIGGPRYAANPLLEVQPDWRTRLKEAVWGLNPWRDKLAETVGPEAVASQQRRLGGSPDMFDIDTLREDEELRARTPGGNPAIYNALRDAYLEDPQRINELRMEMAEMSPEAREWTYGENVTSQLPPDQAADFGGATPDVYRVLTQLEEPGTLTESGDVREAPYSSYVGDSLEDLTEDWWSPDLWDENTY